MKQLTLDIARKLIDICYEKAVEKGHKMVFAVANDHGELMAFNKMDGALLVSTEIAINKSWTSVALKMPTAQFQQLIQPGGDLYGMENSHGGRLITLGGGIPLFDGENVVGAIGVSGGSAEEDAEVAQFAVEYFEKL